MSTCTMLGTAVAFGLCGYSFFGANTIEEYKYGTQLVLYQQTVIMFACFVYFQMTFKDRPEVPPSASAAIPEEFPSLRDGLKTLLADRNLILLSSAFCLYLGLYFSLGNIMSSIYSPFGYGAFEVAIIGTLTVAGGVLGCIVTGIILDKTAAYKKVMQS